MDGLDEKGQSFAMTVFRDGSFMDESTVSRLKTERSFSNERELRQFNCPFQYNKSGRTFRFEHRIHVNDLEGKEGVKADCPQALGCNKA